MKEVMDNFSDLNLTNDEIDKAIKMADTDGDGKISFEEYKATLTKKGISFYTKSLVKTRFSLTRLATSHSSF